jgi:hypothetical protein
MELIIADPTYGHSDRDRDKFLSDLKDEISGITHNFELSDVDIGFAADGPAILVIFGGLFLLGKPINENIEGWLNLSSRFVSFIKKISRKFGSYRIDESGASLIAIDIIIKKEKGNISSIEKITSTVIPFNTFPLKNSKHLDQHPDNLYVQAYRINDERIYLIAVKSNGKIVFKHEYNISWLDF